MVRDQIVTPMSSEPSNGLPHRIGLAVLIIVHAARDMKTTAFSDEPRDNLSGMTGNAALRKSR